MKGGKNSAILVTFNGINIHVRRVSMNLKNVNHNCKRRFFIHTQASDSPCHFQQCDINSNAVYD